MKMMKNAEQNNPIPINDRMSKLLHSETENKRPKILIGCSGSVATVKLPELVVKMSKFCEVLIVCTQNAQFFLERSQHYNPTQWDAFEQLGGRNLILQDSDEWDTWNKVGHDVLHIELRRWADILLIAPASANFLAKASSGCADNLLLSVMRAWDYNKPCVLCPAMNTFMWDHPVTAPTIKILESWGCKILGPVVKMLACKEVGNGAMISVDYIVQYIQTLNFSESRNSGRKTDVTVLGDGCVLSKTTNNCLGFTAIIQQSDNSHQKNPKHMLPILILGISSLFAIDGFVKMMR